MSSFASLQEDLVDAVYGVALQPAAWDDVMQLMKRRFPSSMQSFYYLHMQPHRLQPVWQEGIEPRWLQYFDALYFAADNPWVRLTQRLHQPGLVRTNERLDKLLREPGALYRSAYYNDWMRPQRFKYTIGNTLLNEGGLVANITLMRAPDMPTFDAAEVRSFEALSRHMTRALRMGLKLQRLHSGVAGSAAFDALPQAVALIDGQQHLLFANLAMESLLRRTAGLTLQQGVLQPVETAWRQPFAAHVAQALSGTRQADDSISLPIGTQARLMLHAVPVRGAAAPLPLERPMLLLTASEQPLRPALRASDIAARYGCTPAEARLACQLAGGGGLRPAAQTLGIGYGTARATLKIVFDKVGVHTQAQLVARLLNDAAPPSC